MIKKKHTNKYAARLIFSGKQYHIAAPRSRNRTFLAPPQVLCTPRGTTLLTYIAIDSFCLFLNFLSLESYSMCSFNSDFFHSMFCVVFIVRTQHSWFIHSTINGYLNCFHFGSVLNNAATYILVHVFW